MNDMIENFRDVFYSKKKLALFKQTGLFERGEFPRNIFFRLAFFGISSKFQNKKNSNFFLSF